MKISAPAKINLSLKILRKRADGFHELNTRIAPVALADELEFSLLPQAGEISFTCSDPTVPADHSNLVIKAVGLLQERHGPLPGLRIHLEKHIPHGAGMGGGSSDAAATLRAVNQLANLQLTDAQLLEAAAELGSDVPCFLVSSLTDCSGRGEIVTPVNGQPLRWPILLVKLPFGVPTPWAYSQWQTSMEIPGVDYGTQTVDGQHLENDLERPVFQKHFVLAQLKQWLRNQTGVRAALMSGSGSTVFAVLEDGADLERLQQGLIELVGDEVWIMPTRLLV
jgi:4-diphosphocytidyl-2-C-methyl-D-erythritol kinase